MENVFLGSDFDAGSLYFVNKRVPVQVGVCRVWVRFNVVELSCDGGQHTPVLY